MIEPTISITGIEEFWKSTRRIESKLKQLSPERKKMTLEAAEIIADKIRANAPIGPGRKIRKGFFSRIVGRALGEGSYYFRPGGALRRGVVVRNFKTKGESDAFVGMDYKVSPHAHFLEYGTRNMKKRPFFRPGIDSAGPRALAYIKQRVWDIMQKENAIAAKASRARARRAKQYALRKRVGL